MTRFLDSPEEIATLVPDGASVGITGLSPMAVVRALVRRGARDLHLVGVPTGGLATDLLIGAGSVRSLEVSACQLGETGFAPHFSRAVQEGSVTLYDST
jgi:glutaconate CoA-transferase, subunit A